MSRRVYTDVQFNKLPKWAQDLVRRSEANVEHAERRLTAALASAGFTDSGEMDYAVFPVGERAVRFRLAVGKDRPYIEVRPETLDGEPGIWVSCSDGTYVKPRASNAVFIGNEAS